MKKYKVYLDRANSFWWSLKLTIKSIPFRLHRLYDFLKLGLKDYDWDYGYLLELESYKLSKMAHFFEHSDITDADSEIARTLHLASKLLSIAKGDEGVTETTGDLQFIPLGDGLFQVDNSEVQFKFLRYVNIRNASRFLSPYELSLVSDTAGVTKKVSLEALLKEDLYRQKAWHHYNLLRYYKLQEWWN